VAYGQSIANEKTDPAPLPARSSVPFSFSLRSHGSAAGGPAWRRSRGAPHSAADSSSVLSRARITGRHHLARQTTPTCPRTRVTSDAFTGHSITPSVCRRALKTGARRATDTGEWVRCLRKHSRGGDARCLSFADTELL
jgi:hypothetical protein